MPPQVPASGRPFNPVVTLKGWSAPWRMKNGWKEFHLIAEPVIRELAPGMKATLWGYNGSSPGPTIEVVEGDKETGKVTIKHGPLQNLDMPGMTMLFRLQDAAMFEQIKEGDKIKFVADKVEGVFVVKVLQVEK